MALDYGSKRIGVAISDPTGTIVSTPEPPVESGDQLITSIRKLVKHYEVSRLIIGMPWSLSGNKTESTKAALEFQRRLQAEFAFPISAVDERYTTRQAKSDLSASKEQDRSKSQIDNQSARILLENYLSHSDFKN
ncbi:MAG: hypothetical protein A2722_01795 [Candidatus Doudnabacteria bacterium RIFCSPHIGHO2_01_FULL_50_11]|uniref:Putative pre-16S rRNA nuclease n=1 Tax=Candidatus Doudnabacteria bacterium RIFCSPHIGHO2_01_FULL_50_11 TaxID=1817828 RepID=A0A1F5PN14_9BACT|nr:MAG: hypothetical protein A2722_01795 [Candidatus Doudnabacteria bacterium RIFCSPHIGHO2_01_FULL_50_11]